RGRDSLRLRRIRRLHHGAGGKRDQKRQREPERALFHVGETSLSRSPAHTRSLFKDGELLDAGVLGVTDIQTAPAVERQTVRGCKLARRAALTAEAVQERALGAELLHPMIGRAHPDAAETIQDDADGTGQVAGPAAEAARLRAVIPPGAQRRSL